MSEPKPQAGKIIIPAGMTQPEPHEYAVADIFARAGKDVEFIKPSRIKGSRSPDVIIDGVLWEIKSPTGSGKYTVQTQLKRAAKQSKNIIIDSSRTKLPDDFLVKELQKYYSLVKSIKRLTLVTKRGIIIDINR